MHTPSSHLFPLRRPLPKSFRRRKLASEGYGKNRALSGHALDLDGCAEQRSKAPHYVEAHTKAAVLTRSRRIDLTKLVEDQRQVIRQHADPGVRNAELDVMLVRSLPARGRDHSGRDRNRAARRELGCVVDEISQNMF